MFLLQKLLRVFHAASQDVTLTLSPEVFEKTMSVLTSVTHYERWHREGTPPEPCDFCFNTTEHMQTCPVVLAKQALVALHEALKERD